MQSPATTPNSLDQPAAATTTRVQQEVISLSKQKWQWMAERNVEVLRYLSCNREWAGLAAIVVSLLVGALPRRTLYCFADSVRR